MTTYLTQRNSNQDIQCDQNKPCSITKSYSSRTIVHPKLEMTEPGDHDEQEADAVANTIVKGGKISRKISGGSDSSGITVSNQMESQLNHLQGGGQAMPTGLRSMMESGFGQDFSHVRLHTDSEAADMSSSISARAFTHGNDIYFNRGQFSPNTSEGQKLVAHELTHVVQGGGKVARKEDKDNDKYKKRIHRNMDYYVKEKTWIKDYVLNNQAYAKLESNYVYNDERSPITVIIYTNELSARHNQNRDLNTTYAFEDRDSDASVNDLILNLGKKVLMIQGSPNYYGHKVIDIFHSYGPIENVIMVGHGSSTEVEIDNDYTLKSSYEKFFNNIRYAFNMSDKENKELKHSFLLPECLTGSTYDDNIGLANSSYVKLNKHRKGRSEVFVRGNLSSIYSEYQKYYVDDDGYLKFENLHDSTTTIDGKDANKGRTRTNSTHNNDNQVNEPYASTGRQADGIVKSLNHIDNNNEENFCRSHSSYLSDEHLPNSDRPRFLDEQIYLFINNDTIVISPREYMSFIDSKHCDSRPNDTETIRKIRKMNQMIDNYETFQLNINATPSNVQDLLEKVYTSI